MPKIRVESPAKLNLHLHIKGRQPDGFHEIESLFLALAFGDTLMVETAPEPLSLEICMNSAIPPEKNIISRAVSLFRDRTGYEEGLTITVEKRIPLGGGLGGGSSNAAAALLALNCLAASWGKNGLLNDAELATMGASLGSDVPFFLFKTAAAWVSGKGEQIRPLELPEPVRGYSWVLVNPGFPSDTAEAYRLWDESRGSVKAQFVPSYLCAGNFKEEFLLKPPREWPFFNDFLPAFLAKADKKTAFSEMGTIYQRIIDELVELGAVFAGLSGSGATCFGAFDARDTVETAQKSLLEHRPFVINCRLCDNIDKIYFY